MHRHLFLSVACVLAILPILTACQNNQVTEDELWDFEWETASPYGLDGRHLVGAFDLTDTSTHEDYEAFLIFDSGMRNGSFMIPNSYTSTIFYRKREDVWQSELVAEGTRVWEFMVTNQTESKITMQAGVGIIWLDDLSDLENERARRGAQAPTLSFNIDKGQPVATWQRPNSDSGIKPEKLP